MPPTAAAATKMGRWLLLLLLYEIFLFFDVKGIQLLHKNPYLNWISSTFARRRLLTFTCSTSPGSSSSSIPMFLVT